MAIETEARTQVILIVDDNPANLGVIADYLTYYGFELLTARSGESGLKKAAFTHPDLILLDIVLPGIDGFEVCRRLKTDDATHEIPIIFMTAYTDTEHKLQGFQAGGVDYITKPFQEPEVLARVLTHLRLRNLTEQLEEKVRRLQDTQQKLIHAEKMASLGGLVAGVAHEMNTPLGVGVTAASHLEQQSLELETLYRKEQLKRSDLERYVTTVTQSSHLILQNLRQAAKLVNTFKQVSVDQVSFEQRRFGLKAYIETILLSLSAHVKYRSCRIELSCPEDLELYSYPGAFSQIFSNLIMNSYIHGFEAAETGTIRIDVQADEKHIAIYFSDDGRGMNPEEYQHLFEPFFTTKRGRGGTGLGLHIVYNLVTQTLSGEIRCQSSADKGTRFSLEIPRNPNERRKSHYHDRNDAGRTFFPTVALK